MTGTVYRRRTTAPSEMLVSLLLALAFLLPSIAADRTVFGHSGETELFQQHLLPTPLALTGKINSVDKIPSGAPLAAPPGTGVTLPVLLLFFLPVQPAANAPPVTGFPHAPLFPRPPPAALHC